MAAFSSLKPTPLPLRLILLLLLLVFFIPTVVPDQLAEKAALLEFRKVVRGRTNSWNVSAAPCSWTGVRCERGNVTALQLPGAGLTGVIPPGVFGNLTGLRIVSLRFNALRGPLPSDLAACTELRSLFLFNNGFSGGISVLVSLKQLVRLNLADNSFSGEIPLRFNELPRLATLRLQNNNFSGEIPDLGDLNLTQFNVSFNNLSGSIPPKLRSWRSNSFLGMSSLCGGPLPPCPGEESGGKKKKKKLSNGAIAGIVIACVVGVLFLVFVLFYYCGKKKNRTVSGRGVPKPPDVEVATVSRNGGAENGPDTNSAPSTTAAASTGSKAAPPSRKLVFFSRRDRAFDLEDLLRASAEVLGKGTFGTAYKALLGTGTTVAVKRLKDVDLPKVEFKEKIEAVGKMDHPNVVPLRAYYFSEDEKLLVYDFMPMGSLSALLHGNRGSGRTPLDWETRLSIAVGAARGVQYIHSTGAAVSHGNIKSSNILLVRSDDVCVSDHGLAQIAFPSSTDRVAGYRAPEVTDLRKVSQKADVYSFGVLLLELLTGKAPAQTLLNDEGVDLPRWVQSVVREEWTSEVFDLELLRYQSVEDEMVQLLQLALDCSILYPDKRPTMSEVVAGIEVIQRASLDPDEVEQQKPDGMEALASGPPSFMD